MSVDERKKYKEEKAKQNEVKDTLSRLLADEKKFK